MSMVFYIGIAMLLSSLLLPVILHYTCKVLNDAGKFWITYMVSWIGVILIFISVFKIGSLI